MKKIILATILSSFALSTQTSKVNDLDFLNNFEFQCKTADISSKVVGYVAATGTFIATTHYFKKLLGTKETKGFISRNSKKILALSAAIMPTLSAGKYVTKNSFDLFCKILKFSPIEKGLCTVSGELKTLFN